MDTFLNSPEPPIHAPKVSLDSRCEILATIMPMAGSRLQAKDSSMIRIFAATLIFSLFLTSIGKADETPKGAPIFNGKDLSGWKVPENNIWWLVEDGVLQVRSGPEKTGNILWTEKEFGDFVFECDFRFGEGIIDSGIHLRNKDQIQIGISGSLKRDMTASPYIPGKGYPVEAEGVAALLKAKDWNHLKIVVTGKNYVSYLNGKKVMSYDSDSAIEKGPVGIQLHGGRDMSIDYKNITVAEL